MNFSEALTVKISHDLAGGIGALSSTADLMELDPSFASEAPAMLKKNTQMLMARLKFYRALFGADTKSIDSSLVFDFLNTFGMPITFSGKIITRLELSFVALGIQIVAGGGDILYSNNTLILKSNNLIIKENIKNILSGRVLKSSAIETLEAEWFIRQLNDKKMSLKITSNPDFVKMEIYRP